MAHKDHNKPRKSGGFFLIIFGALLFILAPTYLIDSPELGIVSIVFGFVIGGLGFYLNFIKGRGKIR